MEVKIDTGVKLAPATRGAGAPTNEYFSTMEKMKALKEDDPNLQSFFVAAEVSTLADKGEALKAPNENNRAFANRMNGFIRRAYGPEKSPTKTFTARKVVENGIIGTRIYCVKPNGTAKAPAPPKPPKK